MSITCSFPQFFSATKQMDMANKKTPETEWFYRCIKVKPNENQSMKKNLKSIYNTCVECVGWKEMIAPGQKGKFLPRRQQQRERSTVGWMRWWILVNRYGATKGSEKVGPNSTNAHHWSWVWAFPKLFWWGPMLLKLGICYGPYGIIWTTYTTRGINHSS